MLPYLTNPRIWTVGSKFGVTWFQTFFNVFTYVHSIFFQKYTKHITRALLLASYNYTVTELKRKFIFFQLSRKKIIPHYFYFYLQHAPQILTKTRNEKHDQRIKRPCSTVWNGKQNIRKRNDKIYDKGLNRPCTTVRNNKQKYTKNEQKELRSRAK